MWMQKEAAVFVFSRHRAREREGFGLLESATKTYGRRCVRRKGCIKGFGMISFVIGGDKVEQGVRAAKR